jgi:3-methyladenine DNA glycosylase Tag
MNAAHRSEDKHFKDMFSELSDKFGRFVDVLFEVSEKTTIAKTEQDLFRLYEMYERTGSERAARALKKAGIKIEKETKE